MSPLYFLETQDSRLGRWFIETDRDTNSCAHIVSLIRSGEVKPVKVLKVTEPSDEYPRGECLDVTEDFIRAAQSQADHEPEAFDHLAARFDHLRDERKHMERV